MKNNLLCTLSSDTYKLRKLKCVWVALIIMFCLILISYVVYWISANIVNSGIIEGEFETEELINTMKKSLLFGSTSSASIEFLMAIIVCIFIGKDFSLGAISLSVARGTKRKDVYFSKWLTCVCLFVAYAIISLVLNGIFYAFDGEGAFTVGDFGILMRNFALQLLCGISTVSIYVMITFLARSTGASIAITIGTYILLDIVISIIATAVTAKNPTIGADWTYFFPLQQSDIASTYEKLSATQLIAVIVMPIVYCAISTMIGYFTFEKRDIK